jgi:hypothetical protein
MPIDVNGFKITSDMAKPFKYKDIITNGLVMYLDADSPESYPGSGTNWYDLSNNNNNGVLNGGITYTTNSGYGVIQLNGTGNYVSVSSLNLSSGNFTVIGGTRYTSTGASPIGGRILSGLNNNWLLGHWNNSIANYYSVGWVTGAGAGGTDTNWRIYAGTGNPTTGVYSFYINGSVNTSGGGGSAGPNGLAIGAYGPGGPSEFSNGQVSFVLAYNRVLTAAEITRTYDAFKYRIGL